MWVRDRKSVAQQAPASAGLALGPRRPLQSSEVGSPVPGSQVRKWKFRRRHILSLSHFATERSFLEPPLRVKASGLGKRQTGNRGSPYLPACARDPVQDKTLDGATAIRLASQRLSSVDEQEARSGRLALSITSVPRGSSVLLSLAACPSPCLSGLSLHAPWLCVAVCGDSASLLAVDAGGPATSFSSGYCVARL